MFLFVGELRVDFEEGGKGEGGECGEDNGDEEEVVG